MPKLSWVAFAVFVGAFLTGSGCTKRARMERHLSHGDEQTAVGDYVKAEIEYRTALQLVPDDPVAMGRIGILYYNDGRVVPGYLLLQAAVKSRPEDLSLQMTFGLASLTLAKTADARIAAKKVLDGQPGNEEALLLLVETCVTSRDNEEARLIIGQLRDHNKDGAVYHVALGALDLRQQDRAGAERELRKALELDPKSSAAYAELGTLFLVDKDLKQAGAAIKTGAELAPLRSPRRLKYVDFLMQTGALEDAKRELAKITGKAPDYIPAWTMTMQIAFVQHNYDDCLMAVEKILARDPINYDALMQRAAVKQIRGDTDGVIADLERLAGIYGRAPQVKFQLALAYLRKGDTAHAEEQLNQAIHLSPLFDEAILTLAEINLQKGNAAVVISPLTLLLKREPRVGRASILLAKAYQAQGNLDAALAILRQSAEAAPQSPEAPYLVGTILLELNRPAEARKCFEESVRLAEDYWPASETLVNLDLAEKRTAAAAERAERLIQKYPKAAAPRLFRAKIRLQGGDTNGAESDLLMAIELEPASGYAYFQLAKVYLKTNHTQEAVDKLAAFAAKTNSVAALMQLGMLHNAVKNYPEARVTYEKLLALEPRFVPALNNLAILYSEKLGQVDKGFGFAKLARNIAPTDPVVADTLGWIFFQQGQYDSALPLLQAAAEKNPADPDTEYHLGMAHYFLAQEAPAREAFRRTIASVEDTPAKDDARRRLAVLSIDVATADGSVRSELEKRAQEDSNDPMVLTRLAAIERRDGAASRAAGHYEAALKLSPRSATIMSSLVELYLGPVPQPQRARELAKSAHELAPNDAHISWYLGHLLYKAGEYSWSASLLEEAARQLANSSEVLYDLASAYYNLGRVQETETTLKKFFAGEPPAAARQSAQRLASMIAAAASPEQAQSALAGAREILATEPEYIPALMVSALADEQQGDYQGARQIYENILARNPVFAVATRQLAILYAEHLGDDHKAEELALTARKTFPDDPVLAYELGVVKYRQGDYASAVRFLQQSVRISDRNPEALFFLGMGHFQLKNSTESRTTLQRALDLNLPEQEAKEARRVLDELNRGDQG